MSSSCGHSHHSGMAVMSSFGIEFPRQHFPIPRRPPYHIMQDNQGFGGVVCKQLSGQPQPTPPSNQEPSTASPQNKPSCPRFMLQLSRTPQPRAYIICQSQEQKPLWPHVSFLCLRKENRSGLLSRLVTDLSRVPWSGAGFGGRGVSGFYI